MLLIKSGLFSNFSQAPKRVFDQNKNNQLFIFLSLVNCNH